MEVSQGSRLMLNKESELIWDFFTWSRILFPNERLPHVDSDPSFDLVTLELHHPHAVPSPPHTSLPDC